MQSLIGATMSHIKARPIRESLLEELHDLRTAWLACTLLPLSPMIFWRSRDGRCVALWVFCACCFSLVAYSFRRSSLSVHPAPWMQRMLVVGVALSLAWAVFSFLWIAMVDPHDFVALFVGFQIL